MRIEILRDAEAVARQAAASIAADARAAFSERRRFGFAVSGGKTPWEMLRALREEDVPWGGVHLFQVDERVAPAGDPDRNLTQLQKSLSGAPLPPDQLHAMPVEEEKLGNAAARYVREIEEVAGSPPVLDLVHLGLGADGHTAIAGSR